MALHWICNACERIVGPTEQKTIGFSGPKVCSWCGATIDSSDGGYATGRGPHGFMVPSRLHVAWMLRLPGSLVSTSGEEDTWTHAQGQKTLTVDALDECAVLWDQLLRDLTPPSTGEPGLFLLAIRLTDPSGFSWECWNDDAAGYDAENRRRAGFPPLRSDGSRSVGGELSTVYDRLRGRLERGAAEWNNHSFLDAEIEATRLAASQVAPEAATVHRSKAAKSRRRR